jgi:haloacetate dehalogenase
MNRRTFSLMGLGTAAAALVSSSSAQTGRVPSPGNLEQALPSSLPGPAPCAKLLQVPAPPSDLVSQELFPGFRSQFVKTSSATIRVLTKGDGAPLLLLHGHPETHVTWHKIASRLAERYTVVLTDLRGYGDSSKPDGGEGHRNYSFSVMALDQIQIMQQLGFARFMLAGHDRGGRVAHRLCLDHPDAVQKVAFLDIAPTLTMYNQTNKEFATKYVWWFLQIQPEPMPEHLIGLDPVYYLRDHLSVQCKTPGAVTPQAMAEYIRCYCCTDTIHAMCEDYRAAASIDLDMDQVDDAVGRRIQAPVLALWGAQGTVGQIWDVLATWRSKAANQVTGRALPCGHLLPEEAPEQVLAEFRAFFEI